MAQESPCDSKSDVVPVDTYQEGLRLPFAQSV